MKLIKLLLVIMSAAVITLALSGTGLAFHGDGVAHCDGCHTMHNSANGLPMPDVTPGGDYLLKAGQATTVCLNCHEERGQFSGGEGYLMAVIFEGQRQWNHRVEVAEHGLHGE